MADFGIGAKLKGPIEKGFFNMASSVVKGIKATGGALKNSVGDFKKQVNDPNRSPTINIAEKKQLADMEKEGF